MPTLYRQKDGGWRFEAPKTKRSYRSISITPGLLDELKAHAASQPPLELSEPDLVFRSDKGTPLDSTNLLRRYLRPALKAAGYPSLHQVSRLAGTEGPNLTEG